jgi:hypothetical protein
LFAYANALANLTQAEALGSGLGHEVPSFHVRRSTEISAPWHAGLLTKWEKSGPAEWDLTRTAGAKPGGKSPGKEQSRRCRVSGQYAAQSKWADERSMRTAAQIASGAQFIKSESLVGQKTKSRVSF